MNTKSTTLLLISLGAITVLMAYVAGLFNWMLYYPGEDEKDILYSFRNVVGMVALLAYIYFGIRFFNRFVREQI